MKINIRFVLYNSILIALFIITIGVKGGWVLFNDEKDLSPTIEQSKPFFSSIDRIEDDTSVEGQWFAFAGDKPLGTINLLISRGYGGDLPLLVGATDTAVVGVVLLENSETDYFLEYIYDANMLDQWKGKSFDELATTKIDAVSGATETSRAIITSLDKYIATKTTVTTLSPKTSPKVIIENVLFLAILVFALILTYNRSMRKYRIFHLVAVVVVLGFMMGITLSLKLFQVWIINGITWETNWQSFIVLLLAFIVPFLKQPKFFCLYLCPMGALQELVNTYAPNKKKTLKTKWKKISLDEVYLVLVWSVIVLGVNVETTYFEPFATLLVSVASWGYLSFLFIIIALSFYYKKPWCAVCPTGCAINRITQKE